MGKNSFAIYTASGRILAMLCNFAMPLFLTHYLSQSDYGVYSQFILLLGFAGSIFSFGLQSNLYYFYPTSDIKKQKTLLGNTFFTLLVFALIALIFIESPILSKLLIKDEDLKHFIGIIGVCVLLNIPTYIIWPVIVIRKDKKLSVFYPSLEVLLKVIFTVIAIIIFKNINAIFISLLFAQICLFVFSTIYTMQPLNKIDTSIFDWDLLKSQLKYSLPFGCSIILVTIFRQLDKILCISYISTTEYAIYSLAFYGIPGINQIYDSVCEVNLLNMSDAYKKGDIKETLNLYQNFCTKLLSFSTPVIFIVFLFSREIFSCLFSEEYMKAVPYFRIYIFSFIIGGLGAGTILRAIGKTRYTLRAFLYSSIVYFPFSYLSIKYFGTWGAITTSMLGIILPKLFQIHFERKLLNIRFMEYMPWNSFAKILLISIIFIIPFIVLYNFVKLNIYFICIISIIYLLTTYIIELKYNIFIIPKSSAKTFIIKLFRKEVIS